MTLRSNEIAIVVVLCAILLRVAAEQTANLSYLVIACYALLGRAQAIQALALSWLFTMLSSGVAAEATLSSTGRYAVLAAAAVSVFYRSGTWLRPTRISWPVQMTLLLGTFLVIHSVLFSPIMDVSILKAISWTVVTTTLLSAWSGLSYSEQKSVSAQIFGGLIALLLCSLPLLAMPLGYLRNGIGFQGVLGHPQAFGPAMAMLGAWAGGRLLAQSRPPWWQVGLFGISVVLVVLSEARTAGVALFIGIVLAGASGGVIARRSIWRFLPGLRGQRFYLAMALALMISLLAGSSLTDRVDQYVAKRGGQSSLLAAYETSRGRLMDNMWTNIEAHPLTGIGFGIASSPLDMDVQRDPVLGLPTGAAIEKGVLPLAILEELGVFGLLGVTLWLWMLVHRAARGRGITALTVLFVALLMNMGESVLFSAGGMGLLLLVLIGWAVSRRCETSAEVSRA